MDIANSGIPKFHTHGDIVLNLKYWPRFSIGLILVPIKRLHQKPATKHKLLLYIMVSILSPSSLVRWITLLSL